MRRKAAAFELPKPAAPRLRQTVDVPIGEALAIKAITIEDDAQSVSGRAACHKAAVARMKPLTEHWPRGSAVGDLVTGVVCRFQRSDCCGR